MTGATVVGCVWGAHRHLTADLAACGDRAPSYAWCEAVWVARLRSRQPTGTGLPEWLRSELEDAWRAEGAGSPAFAAQLELAL